MSNLKPLVWLPSVASFFPLRYQSWYSLVAKWVPRGFPLAYPQQRPSPPPRHPTGTGRRSGPRKSGSPSRGSRHFSSSVGFTRCSLYCGGGGRVALQNSSTKEKEGALCPEATGASELWLVFEVLFVSKLGLDLKPFWMVWLEKLQRALALRKRGTLNKSDQHQPICCIVCSVLK